MSSYVSDLSCMHCGSFLGSSNNTSSNSPPCPHLLRTNRPPSKLEASSIRQAITQAKKDRELLVNQIAQLQATMDALCDQSNAIDAFIGEHEAILSPARKILPEILSEIFLWSLAGCALKSPKGVPIVFGQVCSYWRSVAISTPNLWSSLSLYISAKNIQFSTWLVNTALTRSGACPLAIDLSAWYDVNWDEHANSENANPCLDTILNHSCHWRAISFQLPSRALRKLSAVKHPLSMLETLEIWDETPGSDDVLDVFEDAPRLRSLCTNLSSNILRVPGEQLERFDWSGGSRHCLDWLHRCSNLIECTIYISRYLGTELSSSLPLHLPRLTKWKVVIHDEESLVGLVDLFNVLVTTVLTDLYVRYVDVATTQWVQTSFISFLSRSACAIRILCLTKIPMTDVQLIECLRMLPSLVELLIFYYGTDDMPIPVTNILLQQLTHQPPKMRSLPLLSPRLQTLTLNGCFDLDSWVFGDMVASRWRIHGGMSIGDNIARLERVTFQRSSLDKETIVRLKKFKDEGLELDISGCLAVS